ncbi:hypothetical protein BTR23_08545 [Alkalihalophilus pseudofirmus]|nr:hypothetical protein BTR23_08545 [Alkalihalophilus pseudofirmus]
MLFNFVLGLLFPWILLLYVLRKHTKYIILFAPIGASLAFFFNELGFQYFWGMKPIYKNRVVLLVIFLLNERYIRLFGF